MDLLLENVEDIAPVVLHPPPMTDDEFYDFCQRYDGFQVERMADGSVIIMPPTGFETGFRNGDLIRQLSNWADRDGRGAAFDSNTEFILPDGSALSPDASWVHWDRIRQLSSKQKRKFPRLYPDFIVELISPSDRPKRVRSKMQKWIDNGVQLAWLIDPDKRSVSVYRPGSEPQTLSDPDKITGEGPVAGFVLDLASIWAGL
jgi:Uma2 family endonuclease